MCLTGLQNYRLFHMDWKMTHNKKLFILFTVDTSPSFVWTWDGKRMAFNQFMAWFAAMDDQQTMCTSRSVQSKSIRIVWLSGIQASELICGHGWPSDLCAQPWDANLSSKNHSTQRRDSKTQRPKWNYQSRDWCRNSNAEPTQMKWSSNRIKNNKERKGYEMRDNNTPKALIHHQIASKLYNASFPLQYNLMVRLPNLFTTQIFTRKTNSLCFPIPSSPH